MTSYPLAGRSRHRASNWNSPGYQLLRTDRWQMIQHWQCGNQSIWHMYITTNFDVKETTWAPRYVLGITVVPSNSVSKTLSSSMAARLPPSSAVTVPGEISFSLFCKAVQTDSISSVAQILNRQNFNCNKRRTEYSSSDMTPPQSATPEIHCTHSFSVPINVGGWVGLCTHRVC